MYDTINVFCIDGNEWKEYNVYGIDDLKLLDKLDSFANSLIIFDDMVENIRLPAIDSFCSKDFIWIDFILTSQNYIDMCRSYCNKFKY